MVSKSRILGILMSRLPKKLWIALPKSESLVPFLWIFCQLVCPLHTVSCVGKVLIDFVVKYVPQWFPGAGFQRKAARWRWVIATLVDRPWKYVKDGLVCPPNSHHVQITYLAAVGWNSISMRHNGTS